MKIFKGIDVFLQTSLVIIILTGLIIANEDTMSPAEILVALGAVQSISILVHLFIPGKDWKKLSWRKVHHIGTLLVILTVIIILNLEKPAGSENAYYGLGALVYTGIVSLFFVLFYFIITWVEWRRLKSTL